MGRSGPRATTEGDFTGQQTRRPLSFNLFGRVRTCCRWIQAPSRRCTPSATLPDFANVPTERLLFCGVGGSGMTPLALIIQARSGRVEGSDRALDQGRDAERFNFLRTRAVLFIPRTAVACKPRTVSVPRLPLAHVGDRLLHSSGRH
jgi:hypothetical protein